MTNVKLGIIGGSGAKGVVESLGVNATIQTENGQWSGNDYTVDYLHFSKGCAEVYFVLRHGKDHTDLPAKLDQRGMLHFLKSHGVDALVLASATGSLDTTIKLVDEGGFVVNSGTFRGFGYRGLSFNDPERPHEVMADPFHPDMRRLLLDASSAVPGATGYDGGLYIHNEGNSFESPAEIADLVCRLDEPTFRLQTLRALNGRFATSSESALYERLAQNLNRKYAQVSMNAVREVVLAKEAGFDRVALVSLPVNYGAGLVPAEQVDHERTKMAINKATRPYIVPFLRNVIERAPQYVR